MASNPLPEQRPQEGVRVRTMVWGLILLAVAAVVAIVAAGYRVDFGLIVISILCVAGVVLLVSGVVAATRGSRR